MNRYGQLFYFTGTGNTLALAHTIAHELDKQRVKVEITNIISCSEFDLASIVGIVFPVYGFGAPRVVNRFIKRLPSGEGRSAFVVANAADEAGPAADAVAKILARKGYKILGATWVKMPSNYIVGRPAISDEQANDIIATAKAKIADFCASIFSPTPPAVNTDKSGSLAHRLMYWAFLKGIKYAYRFYKSNDKCTGCGACVEMCPTGSITLNSGNRPVWCRGCEHCLRCVNHCPYGAIEFGPFTKGKRRYTYWQGKVHK